MTDDDLRTLLKEVAAFNAMPPETMAQIEKMAAGVDSLREVVAKHEKALLPLTKEAQRAAIVAEERGGSLSFRVAALEDERTRIRWVVFGAAIGGGLSGGGVVVGLARALGWG